MFTDAIEPKEINGYTVRVVYDEDPYNPRVDHDNLGTMVCSHHRYDLGDEHLEEYGDSWLEDFKIHLRDSEGCTLSDVIYLPLYLYDHSGITISTSPFSCSWDSGQVGFIYVTKEKLRKEYGIKRITKKYRERAIKVLEAEVKTYDEYLRGEVYGYVIQDGADIIDSCWGFIGYEPEEVMGEALAELEYINKAA